MKKKRRPSLKRIFQQTSAIDHLRQDLAKLAAGEKPFLPVFEPQFTTCSNAIHAAAQSHGAPLQLPSMLLPPA